MRVKMFTHTDLDGVDVSELAKLFGCRGILTRLVVNLISY